ncbi:MAG: hypothetical protein Ct9H300mP6_15180 [Gammaproteobacteria bacterium]|nr:MAG: hypothetical protein Ct9H300mP6_15180 [Gammaproteobacteria bacterium]
MFEGARWDEIENHYMSEMAKQGGEEFTFYVELVIYPMRYAGRMNPSCLMLLGNTEGITVILEDALLLTNLIQFKLKDIRQ